MNALKNLFYRDGRACLKVIPVEKLKHSGMVKDVLDKGRFFFVDMESGTLSVGSPDEDKPDNSPRFYLNDMSDYKAVPIRLPNTFMGAEKFLRELGSRLPLNTFMVYSNGPSKPCVYNSDHSFNVFLKGVYNVYRNTFIYFAIED